jgi:hypothetical protein
VSRLLLFPQSILWVPEQLYKQILWLIKWGEMTTTIDAMLPLKEKILVQNIREDRSVPLYLVLYTFGLKVGKNS